jgi:hypothetical protein
MYVRRMGVGIYFNSIHYMLIYKCITRKIFARAQRTLWPPRSNCERRTVGEQTVDARRRTCTSCIFISGSYRLVTGVGLPYRMRSFSIG